MRRVRTCESRRFSTNLCGKAASRDLERMLEGVIRRLCLSSARMVQESRSKAIASETNRFHQACNSSLDQSLEFELVFGDAVFLRS
jgi:hypothetical protein